MALDRQTDTTVRGSYWGLVINNPTEEDRVKLQSPPNWLRRVRGQDEVGEQGTLHIQAVCNTEQVRFSSLKSWLPRAHITRLATKLHYENQLKYVHKDETCDNVESRFDLVIRGESEPRTMDSILTRMAQLAWTNQQVAKKLEEYPETYKKAKDVYEAEYWAIARMMIAEEPATVSTFTVPNLKVAWLNTRDVWIMVNNVARQTDITISSGENSPGTV